ncbi:hypothetical protein BASA50_007284 [Batrachochytrium salamandrivorans]|uniref:Uncharacterized protein n=1 Tax=Batrachochytrium salamandrivorans TaxID=1357716 RepID=A0ABQ8F7V7_9FUNG|nr:hypothetical protein BASA50_007284 [Batrachochytrium salamandrivorans]
MARKPPTTHRASQMASSRICGEIPKKNSNICGEAQMEVWVALARAPQESLKLPRIISLGSEPLRFKGWDTTPSPTSKSSAFKEYGFSPKNHASSRNIAAGGVKWAETTTDMPRQSVSSVEMDCSWADSVENRSRITPPNPFAISESSTW